MFENPYVLDGRVTRLNGKQCCAFLTNTPRRTRQSPQKITAGDYAPEMRAGVRVAYVRPPRNMYSKLGVD